MTVHGRPDTFKPYGEIILLNRNYIVPFKINGHRIFDIIKPIEVGLGEIHNAFQKLNESIALKHYRGSELMTDNHVSVVISKNMVNQIQMLLQGVHNRKCELSEFLKSLGLLKNNNRKRRGLVDMGGEILSYTFGIATQKGVDSNKKRISNLEDVYSELASGLDVHASIINASLSAINRIDSQQQNLLQAIEHLNQNVIKLSNVTELKFADLSNVIMLMAAITYVNTATSQLNQDLVNYRLSIEHLQEGKISPLNLSSDQIYGILRDMSTLRKNPILPPTEENLPLFYKIIQVVQTDNPFEYFLIVPIGTENLNNFDLYQLNQIRYPLENNLVLELGNLPKFFAINAELSLYWSFDSLDKCKQVHDLYLCELESQINKTPPSDCTSQLFFEIENLPTCMKMVTHSKEEPKFERFKDKWYYQSSETIQLLVRCGMQKPFHITLNKGHGFLDYEPECGFSNDKVMLPAFTKITANKIDTTSKQLALNITLASSNNSQHWLTSIDALKLIRIEKKGLPISKLKHQLSEFTENRRKQQQNEIVSKTSLSLTIMNLVIILGVVLAATYVYHTCRKLQGNRNNRVI